MAGPNVIMHTVGTVLAALLLVLALPCRGLDNGLAFKPPMGWNSWNAFGVRIDEKAIREMAHVLVDEGYLKAGYSYLNLDDAWADMRRGKDGKLQASSNRFGAGIADLADSVHSKGLKLGIYGDAGYLTCAGFPGSRGFESRDAASYAEWGIDYLKYDNCWADKTDWVVDRYNAMRDALNATGRPILFSLCEWGVADPWLWGPAVGNSWRTTDDIQANWNSVLECLDNTVGLARFAGPNAWNDPDMLEGCKNLLVSCDELPGLKHTLPQLHEVGNGKLTLAEQRAHFALWALLKAPLLIGTDLRTASADVKSILLAEEVIAINQDPLGVAGDLIWKQGPNEVYAAPLQGGGRAVVLFNRHHPEYRFNAITVRWDMLGYDSCEEAVVRDLYKRSDLGTHAGGFTADVEAHGAVVLSITLVNSSAAHEAWRPWDGISATAGGPLRRGRRRAARRGRKAARAGLLADRTGGDSGEAHSRVVIAEHISNEK